ncbi:dienelactone hydrolase family protein [Flavobacterium sharifuzzamanii]|uniref:alpha/beta hydrolase n=1 Tax=Flavobacterium sharifuzzamanii TaxID=2211133 RepID=UPI000DAC1D3C|nr:alpha/beta hydrolase [Flavobacterium sharifuzzamanii]KAF2079589.1 alpha/beta hydrolase [Flavobacterium sharifuzzamanii]
MKKTRLLLLSDLFGGNPEWIQNYIEILEIKFDVQYYDILKLAQIDSSRDEKEIHNQFLNGGIEKAVNNLLNFEKEKVAILGFSIGGTIAWKASLRGLQITQLVAVSSIRLRFETEIPSCKVKLYYGEKDLNKPNMQWFLDLKISNEIIENQDHILYQEKDYAFLICSNFL